MFAPDRPLPRAIIFGCSGPRLTDEEARRDPGDAGDGRLREPFLRWVSLLRAFDATSVSGEYLIEGAILGFLLQQQPMSSPSVFNFFQSDFAPNGPVKEAGLKAPEFQITTDASVVWIASLALYFSVFDPAFPAPIEFLKPGSINVDDIPMALDLSDEQALVDDPDALLDRLDLLLTYGTMSNPTRDSIRTALEATPPATRLAMALNLVLSSPDYAVVE